MSDLKRSMLLAAAAIVVYDTIASLIVIATGVEYARFASGSYLLYIGAGYYGARRGSIADGFMTAWAAGAADVTIGWAVSALLGPGSLPSKDMQSWQVYPFMILVSLFAAAVGTLGALLGARRARRLGRHEELDPSELPDS